MGAIATQTRRKADALRKSGASTAEIGKALGVPKRTVAYWYRGQPLPSDVLRRKLQDAQARRINTGKKSRGVESKFHALVNERDLDKGTKGRIAEAAVLFRLALHGFFPAKPVFDGAKSDWLVEVPGKGIRKIQVRWASARGDYGLPNISLLCSKGHSGTRRYRTEEFDFLVGYDLYTDTAYVFSEAEVRDNQSVVTIRSDAAERWDKLRM